jgi:hypothetical protein
VWFYSKKDGKTVTLSVLGILFAASIAEKKLSELYAILNKSY